MCRAATTRLFSAAVSKRGSNAVSLLPSYMTAPKPESKLPLINTSIAENRCSSRQLTSKINELYKSQTFTPDMIYYQPTHGTESCRKAFKSLFEQILCPNYPFDPDKITLSAGCNAALEILIGAITEPGQTILVPTPVYATFGFDLGARSLNPIVTVDPAYPTNPDFTDPSTYYPSIEKLSAYCDALPPSSHPPVLLLTNPSNPLGITFPPSVLASLLTFAHSRGMHVVSDEIYAGSIHSSTNDFTSVATVAKDLYGSMGTHTHIVYSVSKDFSLSGLRAGAVYSENEEANKALQKVNDLCQVSGAE